MKSTIRVRKGGRGIHSGNSESQLWAAFRCGEEDAFTALYNQYVVPLYHYGERLTGDESLIEDSIHDLFVELWKNRSSLSDTDSVKFYLYRGFKNRLIKNLQKKRKFPFAAISESYQFEVIVSPEMDFIDAQVSGEQKERLLQAINKLAPRQKEALTLRFYDELSYEEIGSLMMLPVKSVYMLIYRGVTFLKQHLKPGVLSLLLYFSSMRL